MQSRHRITVNLIHQNVYGLSCPLLLEASGWRHSLGGTKSVQEQNVCDKADTPDTYMLKIH